MCNVPVSPHCSAEQSSGRVRILGEAWTGLDLLTSSFLLAEEQQSWNLGHQLFPLPWFSFLLPSMYPFCY